MSMSTNDRLFRRLIHKLLLKRPGLKLQSSELAWWALSIGFCLAILGFFLSPLLRIATITCFMDHMSTCPDYIVPAFSNLKGQLIYRTNLQDISAKVQAAMPETNQISVSRQWPNTLIINITSQYDIANLQIPASSSALLIGNANYITGILDQPNSNLPTIIASSAAQLTQGERINDDAILTATDIILHLPNLDTLIINSPLEIRVSDRDSRRYLFTSNKPVDAQLAALQVILADTTINTTDYVYDLRYDHPVLKQAW